MKQARLIPLFFLIVLLFTYLSFHTIRRVDLSKIIEVRERILEYQLLSPLIFLFSQIIQILFPVIPGSLLNIAGGYIFGILTGSILSLLGVLFGSFLVFIISRYLGRRILNLFVKEENIRRYDTKIKGIGPFIFFLLFLLPNPLGDVVFYLYGLTTLPFSFFLPAVLVGRTPGIIFSCYLGAKALTFVQGTGVAGSLWEWLTFGIVLSLLVILFYSLKEKVLEWKIFHLKNDAGIPLERGE